MTDNPLDDLNMFFDRQGQPISAERYAELRGIGTGEPSDYFRVAEESVNGWWVSTVWLGMNHNLFEGPPVIFETMCFVAKDENGAVLPHHGDWDDYQQRYYTEADALAGHAEVVARIRNNEVP